VLLLLLLLVLLRVLLLLLLLLCVHRHGRVRHGLRHPLQRVLGGMVLRQGRLLCCHLAAAGVGGMQLTALMVGDGVCWCGAGSCSATLEARGLGTQPAARQVAA
jgi:hypothetical protein